MKVTVISRWFNEEFFAPYFLSHYAWADEIIIVLEKSTTDRSADIAGQFKNTYIEYCDFGAVLDDSIFSNMMSDLATGLDSDWVIRADADEMTFPYGFADPREALEKADGNVINTLYRWIYRHKDDADLDPAIPSVTQRRHGGKYTIWPGMGETFVKPTIVRPDVNIRWTPGEQRFEPNGRVKISKTVWDGVHWQMVDVDEAVRRLISAEKRLSEKNIKNNWGVRKFTEAMIREECLKHLNDPQVI